MKQDSLTLYRQLVATIREEAMHDMVSMLRAGAAAPPIRRAVVADFKATVSTMRRASAPRMAAKLGTKSGRRQREDVAKVTEQARAYIAKHPGKTIVEIAAGTGLDVEELKHPLRNMRETKVVTMKGLRRGARYTIKA